MKNKWKNINFKIDVLIIFFGVFMIVGVFGFPEFSPELNLLVLSATLATLVYYTYDTHRIANQTVEGGLRPLVLRSGFIESWENIQFSLNDGKIDGNPLEFTILKHVAKDINGYIVINNKKHLLLFGNYISGKTAEHNGLLECKFEPKWGWMNAGTVINAVFKNDQYEVSNGENQIYVVYCDMAGNRYFTRENKNFSQDVGKL